jgi:hypothetical protein
MERRNAIRLLVKTARPQVNQNAKREGPPAKAALLDTVGTVELYGDLLLFRFRGSANLHEV